MQGEGAGECGGDGGSTAEIGEVGDLICVAMGLVEAVRVMPGPMTAAE